MNHKADVDVSTCEGASFLPSFPRDKREVTHVRSSVTARGHVADGRGRPRQLVPDRPFLPDLPHDECPDGRLRLADQALTRTRGPEAFPAPTQFTYLVPVPFTHIRNLCATVLLARGPL